MLCLQYQYTLLFYKMARQAIDLADSARKSDMQVNTKDLLVAPGAGEAVALGGVGVIFKLSGEETGGALMPSLRPETGDQRHNPIYYPVQIAN